MATMSILGRNFSLDGDGEINFFGDRGRIVAPGRWIVSTILGMAEVVPTSIMAIVTSCLEADEQAGNLSRVKEIQLLPRQAVSLFLEGAISSDQLKRAIENDGYILIPEVQIPYKEPGLSLAVRVLEKAEYSVATADVQGIVL